GGGLCRGWRRSGLWRPLPRLRRSRRVVLCLRVCRKRRGRRGLPVRRCPVRRCVWPIVRARTGRRGCWLRWSRGSRIVLRRFRGRGGRNACIGRTSLLLGCRSLLCLLSGASSLDDVPSFVVV